MSDDPEGDLKLGAVIYGRVTGYPWWPGVVSKCPSTDDWSKSGKFWVNFFNDTSGAWLLSKEIRTFDAYSRDLCSEYNSNVPKFRRYHDRIQKAVSMAEDYIKQDIEQEKIDVPPIRIKVVPPRRSSATRMEAGASVLLEMNQVALSSTKPNTAKRPPRDLSKKRPRKSKPSANNEHSQTTKQSEDEQVVDEDTNGVPDPPRPKRKRVKSSRYTDYMAPFQKRSDEEKDASTPTEHNSKAPVPSVKVEIDEYDSDGKVDNHQSKQSTQDAAMKNGKLLRRSRRKSRQLNKPAQNGRVIALRGPRTRKCSTTNTETANSVEPVPGTPKSAQIDYNSSNESGHKRKRSQPEKVVQDVKKKHRSDQKGKDTGDITKKPLLSASMYVSELTGLAGRRRDGSMRRGRVRARAGQINGLNHDQSQSPECTDSEEDPEHERKVYSGSLEVAAENLVDYAIRYGSNSRNGSDANVNWASEAAPVVLGGAELVSSILNRISSLEREVTELRKKAVTEERACLGEDVTAAGVKSAVEALAAASEAFARARDYDARTIGRALEVLWPDGQFPLAGADGDLLRTVAQSLILASCKRRQVRLQKEREARQPNGVKDEPVRDSITANETDTATGQ